MTGRPGRGLDAAAQAFSPCPPGYKSRPAGCKSPHAQRRTHSRALKPLHGCLLTVAGTESQSWRDEKDQVFTAKSFKSTQQQFLRYTANSCRGQSPSRLLHTITSEEVRASAKHPAALRRGGSVRAPDRMSSFLAEGGTGGAPSQDLLLRPQGPASPTPGDSCPLRDLRPSAWGGEMGHFLLRLWCSGHGCFHLPSWGHILGTEELCGSHRHLPTASSVAQFLQRFGVGQVTQQPYPSREGRKGSSSPSLPLVHGR